MELDLVLHIKMVMESIVGFCSCFCPRLMKYDILDLAAPEMIKFGVECKFSGPETSTGTFKIAITNALRDMRELCQVVSALPENTSIKSHL